MDSDSVFGASGLIMENGINSSLNPFYSNPQDYDVKPVHEENMLASVTGQSNGVHHSPLFPDFTVDSDPFPPPDWVVFPPAGFNEDNTSDVFQTTSGFWDEETDIFQPFKDKVDSDLTQSSSTNQNTESSSSANQRDPLLDFILSRRKTSQATPSFTSALDVFQETSSFFSNTDPVSDDIFKTNISDIEVFDPLFDFQDDVLSNQKSNTDLPLIGQESRLDVRMSHVGLQNGAVQEIPHTNSSNGGLMFRRRPPKPAPRRKSLKSVHQPQNTTAEVENDLPVYEDVLLIGQERCVEDWPEHSAELSPEWKPSGKLRLRRDSVLIREASEEVNGTAKKNGKQTLGKKLRHSLTIRRSSKDKIVDEVKISETNTNTLRQGSKPVADGPDEFFTLDEEAVEFKSKKSSKPKIMTHRRGSKAKHTFPADYQDDLTSSSKTAYLTASGQKKDEDMDLKPKQTQKFKPPVPHRPSKDSSAVGLKSAHGPPVMESQSFSKDPFLEGDLDLGASLHDRPPIPEIDDRRNMDDGQKHKKKVKVKFVPQRGFVIGLSRENEDELKGACGFTPHPHIKGHGGMDDMKGMSVYTEDTSLRTGAGRSYSSNHFKSSYSNEFMGPSWDSKASDHFTNSDFSDKHQETHGCRPKKPTKFKVPRLYRRQSKSVEEPEIRPTDHHEMWKPPILKVPPLSRRDSKAVEEDEVPQKGADLFRAGNLELEEDFGWEEYTPDNKPQKPKETDTQRRGSKDAFPKDVLESPGATSGNYYLSDAAKMWKPPILKVPPLSRRDSKAVEEDEVPQKGADLFRAGNLELEEDFGWEEYTPDNKPQKPKETDTQRRGSKDAFPEDVLESPGATSGNYYLSDAAKAEWMSAQMDVKRLRDQEEEQKLEEEEDEGDTDSLMEWWNTVEFWDELPSNERITSKEEETILFKAVADKVHRGLRVYLKLFMERAELLYQHVLILYGIADDLSNFHHRAKIANITGGTTTAVGGAAAIAGLALVPVTLGASIIISAIGLGIATAGGITAASATISDNINHMHDRKKIEVIVQDYEAQLVEMQRCLQFIVEGLGRLRANPLLRRNNYYTGDWEVRRALQTISLVTDPVERAEEITNNTLAKLASLHSGMDKYFTKDMKEVKRGCKKEVTAEVRSLAKQLHEGLVELNSIREQLLDATGNI
ncbi:hypothetical protein R3I93_001252 [Phoxinus phoxinus]|uniref:Apolipoprotein L domain-containing protein 1 n=1 Tax=Phoxinus phoxinus TaxID=58324 RepID=A0AAN9DRH2_9TELE